jgi:predicted NAD-dependent protein-ADP-ribosyltransferase YbiA (DUF1768 family)
LVEVNIDTLIVAFFDGNQEVRLLSNFADTPFTLDGIHYRCVEGFWQSLKTESPQLRERFHDINGLDAKRMGQLVRQHSSSNLFTYMGNLYVIGSIEHHLLLERAIRAKTAQNDDVQAAFWWSGKRPLVHAIKNRFGTWRAGNSPALPAIVFEHMLTRIRDELASGTFKETLPLPRGVNNEFMNY